MRRNSDRTLPQVRRASGTKGRWSATLRRIARNLNRALKAALSFDVIGIILTQQQLALEPMHLRLIEMVFMFICGGQRFRQSTLPVVEATCLPARLGQQAKKIRPVLFRPCRANRG